MTASFGLLAVQVNQQARDLSSAANAETAKYEAMMPWLVLGTAAVLIVIAIVWAIRKNSH